MKHHRLPLPRLAALLGALLCSQFACAVAPPAGTVTPFNNIGLFDSTAGTLTSCVSLQDAQGKPLVDATGKPQIFDVLMNLTDAHNLVFQLQTYTPFKLNAGKDCSGLFQNGAYTDKVLVKYPGLNLDGSVLNVELDLIAGSNLQFQLRTNSPSFGVVRNFAANTTELGSNLGDFQTSAVRSYGTANPATVALRLPTCNDPQGDTTSVVIERNGTAIASATPGSAYSVNTANLGVGDYLFNTYCSDETGIRNLANASRLTVDPAYFAKSDDAPGTMKISVVSGTAPSNPSTTTAPITFQFDPATSASDQQLIQQAVQYARDFMLTTFGRTLQKAATITTSATTGGCANPGSSAFTGSQNMTLCISNLGWTAHDSINKQKIVIHESFHLLQFELHWLGVPAVAGPQWLIEGAAEYFGWLGVASESLVPLDTARGCMLKQVSDFAQRQPPGLPALSALETPQQFQIQGPTYPLGMLGADQLVTTAGINSLTSYASGIAGGATAATSFQTAFGTSLTAFYNQFPAYQAGLAVPPTYLCGN